MSSPTQKRQKTGNEPATPTDQHQILDSRSQPQASPLRREVSGQADTPATIPRGWRVVSGQQTAITQAPVAQQSQQVTDRASSVAPQAQQATVSQVPAPSQASVAEQGQLAAREASIAPQGQQSATAQASVAQQSLQATVPEPPKEADRFPVFRDGDVLIVSPDGKKWKLHSGILSKASPVLRAVFANQDGSHITKKMKEEGKRVKWKLDMFRDVRAQGIDAEGLKYMVFKAIVSGILVSSTSLISFPSPHKPSYR